MFQCEKVVVAAGARVSSFFPGLNDARFESYVTGLSAYTPDGHFILGEIDERPGLYVAAGCCGSGVMSSGGIGEALAGFIMVNEKDDAGPDNGPVKSPAVG